jgi:hypothetical protein
MAQGKALPKRRARAARAAYCSGFTDLCPSCADALAPEAEFVLEDAEGDR